MKSFVFIFSVFVSFSSLAATPLITPTSLSQQLNDKAIFLLDIRPKDFFNYVRIPGSVHSDYSQWRLPQSRTLQKMLPSKAELETLLSQLGIQQNSNIVIIAAGESASDLASASRVYWTLEQLGHKNKSILNGGIIAWATQRLPLTQAAAKPPEPSVYKITQLKPQIKSNDVLNAIKQQNQLIDTRSVAEHKGIILGAVDERSGTIKNSLSLPYDWFSKNQSGQFDSPQNLQAIAQSIRFDVNKPTIVYCHTGHRAALSWFVLHKLLGNKNVSLYDGSTRDWATQENLPMTQAINLEH